MQSLANRAERCKIKKPLGFGNDWRDVYPFSPAECELAKAVSPDIAQTTERSWIHLACTRTPAYWDNRPEAASRISWPEHPPGRLGSSPETATSRAAALE